MERKTRILTEEHRARISASMKEQGLAKRAKRADTVFIITLMHKLLSGEITFPQYLEISKKGE